MGSQHPVMVAAVMQYRVDHATRFTAAECDVVRPVADHPMSGEQEIAVVTDAAREQGAIDGDHTGCRLELPQQVAAVIECHLLQGDHVGIEFVDHRCDSQRIEAPVTTDTIVHIVRSHAHDEASLCLSGSQPTPGKPGEPQQQHTDRRDDSDVARRRVLHGLPKAV